MPTTAVMLLALLLATSAPISAIISKDFRNYANGVIDMQNSTTSTVLEKTTRSAISCAAWCKQQLACNAFSFKGLGDENKVFECRVALGSYTWSPDPNAKLMSGTIAGDVTGYTFGRDGMFYKMFPTTSGNLEYARAFCQDQELGEIPVPYPKTHYDAIVGVPGEAMTAYWLGLTITGTHAEGRWITDDGAVFNTNDQFSDPGQVWGSGEPNGNTDAVGLMRDTVERDWDDETATASAHKIMCRREAMYRRSAVNGKYYRAYQQRATQPEAAAVCQADGGSLANPVSALDWSATEQFRAANKYQNFWRGFWIAGTDAAVEGLWKFPDGTVFDVAQRQTDPNQLRFFHPGEPTNSGTEGENCLILGGGGAADVSCGSTCRFICQIPPA